MKRILTEEEFNEISSMNYRLQVMDNFTKSMNGSIQQVNNAMINASKILSPQSKRLRVVFPGSGFQMKIVKMFSSLGIISGVYDSLSSCLDFIKKLEEDGRKFNEVVIGSHGQPGLLLMTMGDKPNEFYFNNSFLDSFKNIIEPNATVFFTACHGADYLSMLKDASERLGVPCYGSKGTFVPGLNTSAEGFYGCEPEPKFESDNYGTRDEVNQGDNKQLLDNKMCFPIKSCPISWV